VTTLALRRARPLLGTLVEIRVEGLGSADAGCAIDRAFGEIAAVHRLMSFHEAGSDLGRLHRARIGARVSVDARTHDVLAWSLRIAAASAGAFDPTVAALQVERGRLPRPASAWRPQKLADWRDIELTGATQVRLARPLWIDLGGIAKGYAVDRAIEILVGAGATQACVNAGGDLRVAGPRAEVVHVRSAAGFDINRVRVNRKGGGAEDAVQYIRPGADMIQAVADAGASAPPTLDWLNRQSHHFYEDNVTSPSNLRWQNGAIRKNGAASEDDQASEAATVKTIETVWVRMDGVRRSGVVVTVMPASVACVVAE